MDLLDHLQSMVEQVPAAFGTPGAAFVVGIAGDMVSIGRVTDVAPPLHDGKAHPCISCGKHLFQKPGIVCYWCGKASA